MKKQKIYDLETERNVLRLLLSNKKTCNYVLSYGLVSREHFVDLFHRDSWDAINEYYNKHGIPPKQKHFKKYLIKNITHAEKLSHSKQKKMWISSISKLYHSSDSESIQAEIERLDELRKKRILQKSIIKIVNDFENDKLESITDSMNSAIIKCTKYEKVITRGNIVDDLPYHLKRDKQIKKGLIKPVALGLFGVHDDGKEFKIIKFDDYINGGGYRGEMGLIVGETNVGKSFTLMEVGFHAARYEGVNAVINTIEMNKEKEQQRIYSRITGIPFSRFKRGELTKKDRTNLREFAKWWKDEIGTILEVVSFDSGDSTARDIINTHKEIENQYGVEFGISVIDYLNDIKPIGNFKDDKDWSAIGSVSKMLDNWSKNHNNHQGLFVLTANQKKTKDYGKSTTKRGSSQGSALPEHHATWALGLGQDEDDEVIGRVRFDFFKNRDGERSISFYAFPNFAKSRINSIKRIKQFYGKTKKENEK